MNLIFLGPPGSGKGTQAAKIAQKFGLVHLSTGDLLRTAVKAQTELGKKAEGYMSRGELVPDELIIGCIEHKIECGEMSNGFILDGFPRTIPQAESLDKLLARHGMKVSCAVLLKVSAETIVGRIKKRAEIEGRTDDCEDVVRNRLQVYDAQTKPIEDYYRNQSLIREVEGEAAPETVFDRIVSAVS